MRRAVIYVTATYSEFFADPRIMAKDIEQLQAFVCGKGWQLCEETNLDFPGVFHDPADTDIGSTAMAKRTGSGDVGTRIKCR